MGNFTWISSIRFITSTSPVGLLRELVGAVAGANGDGESINACLLDEFNRLGRIGEVRERIDIRAVAIFNTTQGAQFAFHRDAARVRVFHHFTRNLDVVFEARGSLAVGQ